MSKDINLPESSPISPPYSPASPQDAPPRSPDTESYSSIRSMPISPFVSTPELVQPRYCVASHSVRITKHGYAVEPVELRYSEIIKNLPKDARRASSASFDSLQIGHRIIALIRGFWSQPAFPLGTMKISDVQNSLTSVVKYFDQSPTYPHRDFCGRMTRERVHKLQAGAKDRFNATNTPTSPSIRAADQKTATDIFSMFAGPKSPSRSKKSSTGSSTSIQSWIPKNTERIVALITRLCERVEQIFIDEPRIVSIQSPCFVLGDIHGNLIDLRTYERSLWPKAPNCLTSNYLFLGDYVDRGEHSVECVLYLLSMKSVAPNRFHLLRGNHEVATIQRQYTFGKECEAKFGSLGKQLWKSFNRVFDRMPVAAVIDDQVFCAHGGIPRTVSDIKLLAKEIPTPLDNPETQCPAAWEILWNDPITDSELVGMVEMDNAVVTQTHTTRSQPTPDGNVMTTTTTSVAITSEVPATENATKTIQSSGNQAEPEQQLTAQPNSAIPSTSGAATNHLNQADHILSRQPTASHSFYIRPSSPPQQQQQQSQIDDPSKLHSAKSPKNHSPNDDDGALRTVPSDTSSIASTTPQQMISDGFVSNIKRGTAYLFSDQAIKNFLRINNFSHVIRAHEVIPTGFAFHGDGRVITIFSSSRYCGLNNQAACALVEGRKIRILRLDTGEAGE